MKATVRTAAFALAASLARAQESVELSTTAYRGELEAVESALRGGDLEGARARAQTLLSARIAFGGDFFHADATVLRAVASASETGAASRAAGRVRTLIRALKDQDEGVVAEPDAGVLETLRERQRLQEIAKGGPVPELALRAPPLPQRLLNGVASIWQWLAQAAGKLWDWLWRFRPRQAAPEASLFNTSLSVTVMVTAVCAVLVILALQALRGARTRTEETASTGTTASARDADPLSREANEWEAYAAELAARGRWREAIRAWYHAVLVTLFRTGVLHHQKGRTNWEYAYRVPPEAAWRPALLRMTRSFDREWYGHDASTPEALRECAAEARTILRQLGEADA